MESPWGPLTVSDAHVHFFSNRFFAALAAQKKVSVEAIEQLLGWQVSSAEPVALASPWVQELDRRGVEKAVLIGSLPGDYESVIAAIRQHPNRFFGYTMVDPTAAGALSGVREALAGGIRGLCFFPAMHRYSIQDDRVAPLLDVASEEGVVVFVHCGVLSVGVRRKLGLPSPFDMRFSNPMDLHKIAAQHPRLRFVIPNLGAGYLRETLMLCDLCPNVFIDTSSSNSWMRYEDLDLRAVFRRALDVAGPQRLLFGTDSSYFPRGWNAEVFETQSKALYEIGVKEETACLIFHDNLEHLFS
jgi:predicted TIM-barrel fold metal-dependent hydrolase